MSFLFPGIMVNYKEDHTAAFNQKNSTLKNTLKELYLNDINKIKQQKEQEKIQKIESERRELERMQRIADNDRMRAIQQMQQKKKELLEDYKDVIDSSKLNSILKKKNEDEMFLKPNEICYGRNKAINPLANSYDNNNINIRNAYFRLRDEEADKINKQNNFFLENNKSNRDLELFTKKRTYYNDSNYSSHSPDPISPRMEINHNSSNDFIYSQVRYLFYLYKIIKIYSRII